MQFYLKHRNETLVFIAREFALVLSSAIRSRLTDQLQRSSQQTHPQPDLSNSLSGWDWAAWLGSFSWSFNCYFLPRVFANCDQSKLSWTPVIDRNLRKWGNNRNILGDRLSESQVQLGDCLFSCDIISAMKGFPFYQYIYHVFTTLHHENWEHLWKRVISEEHFTMW